MPCYVTSEVHLERFYFAPFDDGLTIIFSNWRISVFVFKLFMHYDMIKRHLPFLNSISQFCPCQLPAHRHV